MADFGIFVGYGSPVRGRELQAIALFSEVGKYLSGLQEKGEIESFEPAFVEPHGGDLTGFFLLRGDRDRLWGVRKSDEFNKLLVRAGFVTDKVGVMEAALNGRIASQMSLYAQQAEGLTS